MSDLLGKVDFWTLQRVFSIPGMPNDTPNMEKDNLHISDSFSISQARLTVIHASQCVAGQSQKSCM